MIRAAAVIVMDRNSHILLLKRNSDHKTQPNQWVFPGGKLDWVEEDGRFEDYHETAVRELCEETGLVPSMIKETEFILTTKKSVTKMFILKTYDIIGNWNIVLSKEHVAYEFASVNNYKKLDLSVSTDTMLQTLFYNV